MDDFEFAVESATLPTFLKQDTETVGGEDELERLMREMSAGELDDLVAGLGGEVPRGGLINPEGAEPVDDAELDSTTVKIRGGDEPLPTTTEATSDAVPAKVSEAESVTSASDAVESATATAKATASAQSVVNAVGLDGLTENGLIEKVKEMAVGAVNATAPDAEEEPGTEIPLGKEKVD